MSIKSLKTVSAINKTVSDVKKICRGTDLTLQSIFVASHIYFIVMYYLNIVPLIINSILLVLGLGYLVFDIITLKSEDIHFKEDIKRKIKLSVHYTKFALRLFTIGFSVYQNIIFGATMPQKVLTIVLAIMFVIQIIFDIISRLVEYYFNLINVGIKMDYEAFESSKVGKVVSAASNYKASAIDIIDKSFVNVISKVSGESFTDDETNDVENNEQTYSQREIKFRNKLSEMSNTQKEKDNEVKDKQVKTAYDRFKKHVSDFKNRNNKQ